jgi:hypothetical protein
MGHTLHQLAVLQRIACCLGSFAYVLFVAAQSVATLSAIKLGIQLLHLTVQTTCTALLGAAAAAAVVAAEGIRSATGATAPAHTALTCS